MSRPPRLPTLGLSGSCRPSGRSLRPGRRLVRGGCLELSPRVPLRLEALVRRHPVTTAAFRNPFNVEGTTPRVFPKRLCAICFLLVGTCYNWRHSAVVPLGGRSHICSWMRSLPLRCIKKANYKTGFCWVHVLKKLLRFLYWYTKD